MDPVILKKSTTILDSICSRLCKDYDILFSANLLDYDYNMQKLKVELSRYASYTFNNNQRIIFSLYDTDYYFLNSKVGFTSYNLLKILNDLDINLSNCILFTNHIGLKKEIKLLCREYFWQDNEINIFENNYSTALVSQNPDNFDKDPNDITHHFCFLSNVKRNHRWLLRIFLYKHNLEKKTIMAWHAHPKTNFNNVFKSEPTESISKFAASVPKSELLESDPFTRINDKIYTNNSLSFLLDDFNITLNNKIDPEIKSEPNENNFSATFLKKCFVNIVTETVFDFPYPYITEKTFKCFWHKTPFLIVGPPHSLLYLKNLGFKTFDLFWDESYDEEFESNNRLIKIFDVIDTIASWPIEKCIDIHSQMLDILEYNFYHYKKNYIKKDLDLFIKNSKF